MASYEVLVVARIPAAAGPPAFEIIDAITWTRIVWVDELSRPQQMSVTFQGASLRTSIAERFSDLAYATELWLSRDGQRVAAGPVLGVRPASGDQWTVSGGGILSYLWRMGFEQDLSWSGIDQHLIAKALVDQWQALEFGHYGIDTSVVTASGITRDYIVARKELDYVGPRLEELSKRAGTTGFDFHADPTTRSLQLWSPQTGVDRSTGEDAIVFDGRAIKTAGVVISLGPKDMASEAYGIGTTSGADQDQTLWRAASNPDLRAKFGRCAVMGTFQTKEQSVLDDHLAAMLASRGGPLVVPDPDVRSTPNADLADYAVGDTLAYRPNAVLDVAGAYRLRKRTVTVEQGGAETVAPEFA